MKTKSDLANYFRPLVILVAVMLSVVTVQANPIEMPERSITPEVSLVIGGAILLEVICVWFVLRRARRPRFFVFWLAGMHLITYPAFLGVLWMLQDLRPASAVAVGEGLVVVVEGIIIYLICRYAVPAKPKISAPSMAKCWLASLIGNICSAAAFPVLLTMFKIIGRSGSG
jgi:hypothetical protein